MGSRAYRLAGQLDYKKGDCLLEVGSERGEGSTEYLAALARGRRIPFWTVDPDRDAWRRTEHIQGVHAYCTTGELFLKDWRASERPRFAYLDGADWPYSWLMADGRAQAQAMEYAARGLPYGRQASMGSHLVLAVHLDRLMGTGAVIVLDDTWKHLGRSPYLGEGFHECWSGKGGLAVPYLISMGWEVLEATTGAEPEAAHVALRRP